MILQIITYIFIGLAGIANLWVGYERQLLYMNYVFPTAKWPGFAGINKALSNPEHAQWHPRLRRLKKILLASWILPGMHCNPYYGTDSYGQITLTIPLRFTNFS